MSLDLNPRTKDEYRHLNFFLFLFFLLIIYFNVRSNVSILCPALNFFNLNLMLHHSLQEVCEVPLRLVDIPFGIQRGKIYNIIITGFFWLYDFQLIDRHTLRSALTNLFLHIFNLIAPCSFKKGLMVQPFFIFLPSSFLTMVRLWMKRPSCCVPLKSWPRTPSMFSI